MKSHVILMVFLFLYASTSRSAAAECSYNWMPGEGLPGFNGNVSVSTTWDSDGAGPKPPLLVLGGNFWLAHNVFANRIVTWDGSTWQALGGGLGSHSVFAMTVYNGELIAGGSFTNAEGFNHIARWDGTAWQPMGSGLDDDVHALAVYNGDLIAGGEFTTANGVTVNRIARWDGTAWQPMGVGFTGSSAGIEVDALIVYNGQLIAGGTIDFTNSVELKRIARWTGTSWVPLGSGMNAAVRALTLYNGELIAGGPFVVAGGVSTNNIARWNGTNWRSLASGLGGSGFSVDSLTVNNGELFAGGSFTTGGANHIARWNGASWQGLDSGMNCCGVDTLTFFQDELIAAGHFTSASGVRTYSIAHWNGTAWRPLNSGMHNASTVLTVHNGELISVGGFSTTDGVNGRHIARWNGTTWGQLGSGLGTDDTNDYVYALATFNGDLIAGGKFATAGGVSARRIARWNGTAWAPLGSGLGSNNDSVNEYVYALAIFNGELIAGGNFTTAGGVGINRIARWDGATWQPLGTGMNGNVSVLTNFNGELIAGGSFTTAGGVGANRIARWDGTNWQPLGEGMNDNIFALTIFNDELIAGGNFTTAGEIIANHAAQWDGTDWQPLGTGMNGNVFALTNFNGELIAGGGFTTASDSSANRIARWDGTEWEPLGTGLGPNNGGYYVSALATFNSELIAGGLFYTAGDDVSVFWARWAPDCAQGDMNCDGVIDVAEDLPLFVQAILDAPLLTPCDAYAANTDNSVYLDGTPAVDGLDIEGFVTLVTTGP